MHSKAQLGLALISLLHHAASQETQLHRRSGNGTLKGPNGADWGNVVINNHCKEPLNLWSVGVWPLHGHRDPGIGFGTEEETKMHTIKPGETYTEPYRVTCPYPLGWTIANAFSGTANWTGYEQINSTIKNDTKTGLPLTAGYCIDEDKLAGQGVAIKIARGTVPEKGKVLQLEYALLMDPNRGDPNHRINYDVSLLDCGPEYPGLTDFTASPAQLQEKFAQCPGYKGGLSLTFNNDTEAKNCPPTVCNDKDKCFMAYLWDRTRQGESSLSCEDEYFGNMTLDLCVENADKATLGNAQSVGNNWQATAMNLPSGVTRPAGATLPISATSAPAAATPAPAQPHARREVRKKKQRHPPAHLPFTPGIIPRAANPTMAKGFAWPSQSPGTASPPSAPLPTASL